MSLFNTDSQSSWQVLCHNTAVSPACCSFPQTSVNKQKRAIVKFHGNATAAKQSDRFSCKFPPLSSRHMAGLAPLPRSTIKVLYNLTPQTSLMTNELSHTLQNTGHNSPKTINTTRPLLVAPWQLVCHASCTIYATRVFKCAPLTQY